MQRWYFAAVTLMVAGGLLWAGDGRAESVRRQLVRPTAKPAPAEPSPTLARYLDRVTVLPGKAHKGLTVYPLVAKDTFPLQDYLTLDEALKGKTLKVTELEGGAQVNTLLLENTGDKHVFVLAGEVIKGAKQDRTFQNDLLVPPRSGKLKVSAFCTEQGRWVQQSSHFESADSAVPNSVRKAAKLEKQQGRVWASISKNQEKLRVAAPTGAAKAVYESGKVKEDMKPYYENLSDVPKLDPDTVGVAATFGDKLIALDVFGDDDLFERLYPKLLRSYVVDVLGDAWNGTASADDVKKWLSAAGTGAWSRGKTDGVGLGVEFRKDPLSGSALLYKEMLVHTDVFVSDAPTLEDGERHLPRLPDLDYRRQQRNR